MEAYWNFTSELYIPYALPCTTGYTRMGNSNNSKSNAADDKRRATRWWSVNAMKTKLINCESDPNSWLETGVQRGFTGRWLRCCHSYCDSSLLWPACWGRGRGRTGTVGAKKKNKKKTQHARWICLLCKWSQRYSFLGGQSCPAHESINPLDSRKMNWIIRELPKLSRRSMRNRRSGVVYLLFAPNFW